MAKAQPPSLDAVPHVTSSGIARGEAIGWQQWAGEQNLSYSELADWQAYFEALAAKFPELTDEFKENSII